MTGGNGLPNTHPIFDGNNWERCRKQMKAFFDYKGILKVVTNGVQELITNENKAQKNVHKEDKKKDYKVIHSIQATTDVVSFDKFSHVENTKKVCHIDQILWSMRQSREF